MATNNVYVGKSTIYIVPGVGAFATIAETEPLYASNGFQQLRDGKTIEQAIRYTMRTDREAHYRQVAGLDVGGNTYAFTGSALEYWQGDAGHRLGNGYAVLGNQLAGGVLDSMAHAFERAEGTLAQRLLAGPMDRVRQRGRPGPLMGVHISRAPCRPWVVRFSS